MKKANFSFVLAFISTLSFFTSCTSYGPAFSHQRITYMERPFGEAPSMQVYVSGKVGNDATYKADESNRNGEIGAHIGLNASIIQMAVGVFGFGGQYKDLTKKDFSYHGFGFRLYQNWKIPVNENCEIQFLGLGYTFNSERGNYEELRVKRSVDSIFGVKDLGMTTLTMGARYRTKNQAILGIQYAYGTSGLIILPINASHCVSLSGAFKNTTFVLNLSIPQKSNDSFKPGLNPTISLGLTQSLSTIQF